MTRKKIIFLSISFVYLALFVALISGSFNFQAPSPTGRAPKAQKISTVTAYVSGSEQNINLPHSFRNLAPRTPVIISFEIKAEREDSLYIKSVYAPLKVYAAEYLLFEYGQKDSYPKFMADPATAVKIISLPDSEESFRITLEYLSPAARDVLTVHPPLLGSETVIINTLFDSLGFSFVFSIIQIVLGLIMLLVAGLISFFERKGRAFFWLGAFAIVSGLWALGECDLTGLFIHNYTLLYLLAFIGLFTFPIPLIFFGLVVVDFRNEKPLLLTAYLLEAACITAFALQLAGRVPLAKSMYLFHLLVPFSLVFFAGCVLYEGLRYKNKNAVKFFAPIATLALFAVLELINYQLRFTNVISFFFQIGIVLFIFMTSIIGALFVRQALILRAEKHRLEFEFGLMEKQIESQRKHQAMLLENAELLKAQRHDLRHQLAVIQNLNERGNKEGLTEYLHNLIEAIPGDSGLSFCENIAVNAIVTYYAELAKKSEIKLDIRLVVPKDLSNISDSSLCVVFGNLLENALEACRSISEGEKFIRLQSRFKQGILTITMDNSFDGNYEKEQGKFLSRKRKALGTGLSSITAVAEKNGGGASFEIEELIFQSSVYLLV